MPVKRRKSKARPDETKAWLVYMMSGADFFDELVDAGIVEDRHNVPRELAEETWHRIGHDILIYMGEFHVGFRPPARPIWAEQQFGLPNRRRCHAR